MLNCLDNWSTAVVDYETFCQIRDHLGRQQLPVAQPARALALHPRTVAKWAGTEQFRPRAGTPRTSKLDAFKGHIVRWLDAHPYSAQQIFQRLGEAGYGGGISIVKDYVHRIRPRHQEAFLTLDFAAGEAAQSLQEEQTEQRPEGGRAAGRAAVGQRCPPRAAAAGVASAYRPSADGAAHRHVATVCFGPPPLPPVPRLTQR